MKERIVLHIGMPKTGSTALQHFCELNSSVLHKHGLEYYPERFCDDWVNQKWENEEALEFLDAHIGNGKTLLISDESISALVATDPSLLKIKDRYPSQDFKIIVYLRRQDMHLESLVNFLRHQGLTTTQFEWIDFPSSFNDFSPLASASIYEYKTWLTALADMFGKENIIVRRYEPRRFVGGSIFADFLDALGIPFSEEFSRFPTWSNDSLDQRFTELTENTRSVLPNPLYFENSTCQRALLALNETMGFTKKRPIFTEEEQKAIMEYHRQGNDCIAREFLGEEGPLFDQTLKPFEKDAFKEGDLELLPGVLNKIWFESLVDMDPGTFNVIKMRGYQDRFHAGDRTARWPYLKHKLINSIRKRISKKFSPHIDFKKIDIPTTR
jgi:hypothetical protein